MDRKNVAMVCVTILCVSLILGVSHSLAQRDFRTEPRPPTARYQVANVTDGEIILLDVTTGDLYSAKPKDVKPFNARPLSDVPRNEPFKDKEKDKDSDKVQYPKEKDKYRSEKDKDPFSKEKKDK